jgi:hypothetical protein
LSKVRRLYHSLSLSLSLSPQLFLLRFFGGISLVYYCVMVLLIAVCINGPQIIIAGVVANDLVRHSNGIFSYN